VTRTHDMTIHDYVRELTAVHQHREHYTVRRSGTWYGQDHVTRVPALLVQLGAASPSSAVEERDNTGYGSRPAARLEASDTLARIDHEAARWVRTLGYDDPGDKLVEVRRIPASHGPTCPTCRHSSCATIRLGDYVERRPIPRSGTARCIRLLAGLTPSLDPKTRTQLTADLRRWWTWARIISGWDSAAWRPDNTCPMCGERRSLRVNLAAEAAFCVADGCRETWDHSNIGLLADHIRQESEQERTPPPAPVPCHCRWPNGLREQGRWGLCPTCGSPCCVNAEVVAEREEQRRRAARELERIERMERIARDYGRSQRTRAMATGKVVPLRARVSS